VTIPVSAEGLPALPLEIDPAYALDAAELMKKGLAVRGDP